MTETVSAAQRREQAMALFTQGYNCAQSVVLAFADLLPLDADTLARLSSSFGGGLGRLREVCGAVSGMGMVCGFLYGYADPKAKQEKTEQYARVQELAKAFADKHGSIVCRELLHLAQKHDDPQPEARTAAYYAKRPCKEIVGDAAFILESYLETHPLPNGKTCTAAENKALLDDSMK